MYTRRWLIVAAGIAVVGCGPSDGANNDVIVVNSTPNNANNTNPNSVDGSNSTPIDEQTLSDRDQAIFDGFNVPADAKSAADGALSLTVEAAVLASLAANGGAALETTGTLTQMGQNFSYSAGPNDRLVVAWAEGEPTEIFVSQLDGNFEAETVDEFFNDNHVVESRVVRAGAADIQVGSAKNGGTRQGGIAGTITEDGVTYTLDLEETGTTGTDVDVSSSSHVSESQLTGSITAPNLSLTVSEDYYYKHIFVDDSVENRSRTTNSQWTYNGVQYGVNGVFIRGAFLNGYPNEEDFWRAEGTITEDGVVVGQVTFEPDEFVVRVVLVLDSGEKITLQEHLKYDDPND